MGDMRGITVCSSGSQTSIEINGPQAQTVRRPEKVHRVRLLNQIAFPEIFPFPVGRGNVPRPLSLNDQARSRMRFTLVASSFLRSNSEAKASAILRRFFPCRGPGH